MTLPHPCLSPSANVNSIKIKPFVMPGLNLAMAEPSYKAEDASDSDEGFDLDGLTSAAEIKAAFHQLAR